MLYDSDTRLRGGGNLDTPEAWSPCGLNLEAGISIRVTKSHHWVGQISCHLKPLLGSMSQGIWAAL